MSTEATQSVIESYNTHAERYDSWYDRHPTVFASEIEALKRVWLASGEGLEIGVGSGRFSEALHISTGVEPAENLRRMAQSRGLDVVNGVAESLPFPDESFDYVAMIAVLCALSDPLKAFQEARRVLKPKGQLIIGMIDPDTSLGKEYRENKASSPFYCHAQFWPVSKISQWLEQLGFAEFQYYQTLFEPEHFHKQVEDI